MGDPPQGLCAVLSAAAAQRQGLVGFDLPVQLRREHTAIGLLGGKPTCAGIAATLPPAATCWLRLEDPLSHPIVGDRESSCNFLLRVKRRKPLAASSSSTGAIRDGEELSAEFLGPIRNTYRFDGIADFQFLQRGAPLLLTTPILSQALEEFVIDKSGGGTDGAALGRLLTLPSGRQFSWMEHMERGGLGFAPTTFFPDDKPHRRHRVSSYRLAMSSSMSALAGPGKAGAGAGAVAGAGAGSAAVDSEPGMDGADAGLGGGDVSGFEHVHGAGAAAVDGSGMVIESSSAAVKDAAQRLHYSLLRASFSFQQAGMDMPVPSRPLELIPRPGISESAVILRRAFALRPVWTMQALDAFLATSPPPTKYWKFALPAVAYKPSTGLLRMCWIRLGYDPRMEPESRLWLPIEVRMPKPLWPIVPQGVTRPNARGARKVRFNDGSAAGAGAGAGAGSAGGDNDADGDGDDDDVDGDEDGGDADDDAETSAAAASAAASSGGAGPGGSSSAGASAGAASSSSGGRYAILGVRVVRRLGLQLADAYAANLLGVLKDPSAAIRWDFDAAALLAAARPTSSSSTGDSAARSSSTDGAGPALDGGADADEDSKQATVITSPDGTVVPLSRRAWRALLAAVPAAPEWSFESAWLTKRTLLRAREFMQLLVAGFAHNFAPAALRSDGAAERLHWLSTQANRLKLVGGLGGSHAVGRPRKAPSAAAASSSAAKGKQRAAASKRGGGDDDDSDDADAGDGAGYAAAGVAEDAAEAAPAPRRRGAPRAASAGAAPAAKAAAGEDDSGDSNSAAGTASRGRGMSTGKGKAHGVDGDSATGSDDDDDGEDDDDDEDEDEGFTRRKGSGRGRGRGRGRARGAAAATSAGRGQGRGRGRGGSSASNAAADGAGADAGPGRKRARQRSGAADDGDSDGSGSDSDEGDDGSAHHDDAAAARAAKAALRPKAAAKRARQGGAGAADGIGAAFASSSAAAVGRPLLAPGTAFAAVDPSSILASLEASLGISRHGAPTALAAGGGVAPQLTHGMAAPAGGAAVPLRLPAAAASLHLSKLPQPVLDDGEEFEI